MDLLLFFNLGSSDIQYRIANLRLARYQIAVETFIGASIGSEAIDYTIVPESAYSVNSPLDVKGLDLHLTNPRQNRYSHTEQVLMFKDMVEPTPSLSIRQDKPRVGYIDTGYSRVW